MNTTTSERLQQPSFPPTDPPRQNGERRDARASTWTAMQAERDRQSEMARLMRGRMAQMAEAATRNQALLRTAAAEIAALRASTSWKVTRPLRLVSKGWTALRRGPAYWRLLYAVREQVAVNWRQQEYGTSVDPTVLQDIPRTIDLALTEDAATVVPHPSIDVAPARVRQALARARARGLSC